MKKNIIKSIALSLLGLWVFSGCESLDQEPTNKFTDNKFWTSTDRAQMVLNMAYNQMYSVDKIWQDEAISDNMVDPNRTPDTEKIRIGTGNPATGIFQSEWKWVFEGVKTTNVFMDKIDLVPNMDPAVKARMIDEVRFIRAMLYFRLTNFYGDIPFFLKDINVFEAKEMTRTPKATVMQMLHQELDDIITAKNLPSKDKLSSGERGRITLGAAVMLKARLYLQQMDMVNVEKYCGYLINEPDTYGHYSLFNTATEHYSAYENLFLSAFEYNDEVILDYAAVSLVKEWGNYSNMAPISVPGVALVARVPTQSLVDSYITLNGLPVKGSVTNPAPYTSDPSYNEDNPYVNRDPRLAATVIYHGAIWKDQDVATGTYTEQTINIRPGSGGSNEYVTDGEKATKSGYFARKAFDPAHRESCLMNNNAIVMRYADVLLMYAEAKEYNGTFSKAVWDMTIKPIRQRAGFQNSAALEYDASAAANMREIIRRERRCELALEGERYLDIVRWGEGNTLLNGICYGAKMAAGNQYIKVSTRKFTVGRDELWSLPQYDMNQAPGIMPNNPKY